MENISARTCGCCDEIAAVPEDHIYFVDDEMFINAARAVTIATLSSRAVFRTTLNSFVRITSYDLTFTTIA